MKIELHDRTESHVKVYYSRTQDDEIRGMIPQKAQSVEEALNDYYQSITANSTSYGRTIYADGNYVGDVWCYSIDGADVPQAMLSYCVFEKQCWKKGIASAAVKLFLAEMRRKYGVTTVGAFTYSDNVASIGVLENNHFNMVETFNEDGTLSYYLECESPPLSLDEQIAFAEYRKNNSCVSSATVNSEKFLEKDYPYGKSEPIADRAK